jgi:membrane-associated protease RseP (regulator of RpoE activity)
MMTRNKLALVIALIFSVGVVAGGIAYAQEALAPPALDDSQEPGTTPGAFTFFVDGGAFLGVHAEEITKENMGRYGVREARGVGVIRVVKGSAAEKAGLKKDDVILRFDGEPVTNVRKLNRLVSEASADQTVRLTISRGGAEQEVSVTLSKRSEVEGLFGSTIRDEIRRGMEKDFPQINSGDFVFSFGANRRIGVSTQTLTKQLADYFGVKDGGLLITSVNENSPAAKAGLKAGDVITAVDGEKVASSGDIVRAINKKQDGDITLTVVSNHSTRTVTLTPEKNPERQLIRPGTVGTNRAIRDQVRDSIRRGVAEGIIVIPRIEVPEVNIQTPRIVVPAIPPIQITVPPIPPRAPGRARVIII